MGSEQEIDESSAFNYLAWGITGAQAFLEISSAFTNVIAI